MDMIGNVSLNMDYFVASDNYSDGEEIEDLLLNLVKENGDIDYTNTILENPFWPIFYHLSAERENILSWYPFDPSSVVLEIGAGCGAVTGALLKKCNKVVSLDLSYKRCLINAYRHRNASNLEIIVANFSDVIEKNQEKFDYVTLIGVFEYAAIYMHVEKPFIEMLKQIKRLLKPGGKVLIAIENKYGLKYFSGCREDHTGEFFRSIEGYEVNKSVQTFSRKELKTLCEAAGLLASKFYYPYPDYKFPDTIYTDEYLPKPWELIRNYRNFDNDRIVLFDENYAYEGILDAGLFQEFSNSFFVEVEA